jgi:hypothetical protein
MLSANTASNNDNLKTLIGETMITTDDLQAHLHSGKPIKLPGLALERMPAPALVCADGFTFSAQASAGHYCSPRNNEGPYTAIELGFPSAPDEIIAEWREAKNSGVYAEVPIEVVLKLIAKHGGLLTSTPHAAGS